MEAISASPSSQLLIDQHLVIQTLVTLVFFLHLLLDEPWSVLCFEQVAGRFGRNMTQNMQIMLILTD
jgi:hypothetical protein